MSWRQTGRTLLELLLALSLLLGASYAQAPTTQVTETVYRADGHCRGRHAAGKLALVHHGQRRGHTRGGRPR